MRTQIDAFLSRLARVALRGFFTDIEIAAPPGITRDRPFLVVANHFNGFVDPVVLVSVFDRTPRFLAKASLWKLAPARPLLAFAGILPVARREDSEDSDRPTDNRSTFAACHDALRQHEVVALFPEGTTHDRPSLDRIRTGAARIALGARAAGVEDLAILPIGIAFEDKISLRSRALVRVGAPIELDDEVGHLTGPGEATDESNHELVNQLTELIGDRLAGVSPDYSTWSDRVAYAHAANVALRTTLTSYREVVPISEREDLAQKIGWADDHAQQQVIDALERYELNLSLLGLRDDQVMPTYTTRGVLGHVAWTGSRMVALSGPGAVGAVLNAAPYWAVKLAGQSVEAPVTKGTVRILTALGAFPLTWIAAGVLARRIRRGTGLVTTLGAPACGFATVYAFERWSRARDAWQGWQATREQRARLHEVLEHRAEVVAAVEAAVGEPVAVAQPRQV